MWIRLGVCSLNIRVKTPLKYEGGGKPEMNKQNVPNTTWTGILPLSQCWAWFLFNNHRPRITIRYFQMDWHTSTVLELSLDWHTVTVLKPTLDWHTATVLKPTLEWHTATVLQPTLDWHTATVLISNLVWNAFTFPGESVNSLDAPYVRWYTGTLVQYSKLLLISP